MIHDSPALAIRDLTVTYRTAGRARREIAVRNVNLTVRSGEVLALVGESGSGKSSTIRAALGLIPADSGQTLVNGQDLLKAKRSQLRGLRRQVQMVFQDPYSSLDPLMPVSELLAEPLKVHTSLSRRERDERIIESLERVGLGRDALHRLPADFSGGQRQRIAIARALIIEPAVLVCDEPVSALDVSTQNQVLALIGSLCATDGIGVLIVAHDLAVVRQIADRVAVMYRGDIVEERTADALFDHPAHPYTRALLDAAPTFDRAQERTTATHRSLPEFTTTATGCTYASRCPNATEICQHTAPGSTDIGEHGRFTCHHPLSQPATAATSPT